MRTVTMEAPIKKRRGILFTDEFSYIPAGPFRMGSNEDSEAERPIHDVWVSAFWCAPTPVTNAEFGKFVNETGYRTTAEINGGLRCTRNGRRDFYVASWLDFANKRSDHPVVGVSWLDAKAYCEWLSQKTGLAYRLPTEAEWEKAARGGLEQAAFPWGDKSAETVGANFGHLGLSELPRTVAVTEMPRNGYGLQIGGNTWEWVQDWFDADYYKMSSHKDPKGPETGVFKVRRSGAFNNRRSFRLRVASRNRLEPDKTFLNMGFRVVRSAVAKDKSFIPNNRTKQVPVIEPFQQVVEEWQLLSSKPAADLDWDGVIQNSLDYGMALRDQIEGVLNVLRPNMEEDDGGVEVVEVKENTACLRMIGTCHNCPKSAMTFRDIAETLRKHIPALQRVEQIIR